MASKAAAIKALEALNHLHICLIRSMKDLVKTERQLEARKSIHALEDLMLALPDKLDIDELTDHFFAPGIYARMIFIPAGGVVSPNANCFFLSRKNFI